MISLHEAVKLADAKLTELTNSSSGALSYVRVEHAEAGWIFYFGAAEKASWPNQVGGNFPILVKQTGDVSQISDLSILPRADVFKRLTNFLNELRDLEQPYRIEVGGSDLLQVEIFDLANDWRVDFFGDGRMEFLKSVPPTFATSGSIEFWNQVAESNP